MPCVRFVFVALALLLSASAVQASLCPGGPGPGQVQIGVARGPGFNGAPICAPDPNAQADAFVSAIDQAALERELAEADSRALMRDNIEALTRSIQMIEAGRRSLEGIDPELSIAWLHRDHAKGWWELPDLTQRTAAPGEFCSVMFASERGLIGLYGPGGDYRGAMLTFWSENVPRPDGLQLVDVSLRQNDERTVQTVKAYNYTESGRFGVVALGVPSIQALLDNMEDDQRFRLSMAGTPVVDMAWHSGLIARDALRSCMASSSR